MSAAFVTHKRTLPGYPRRFDTLMIAFPNQSATGGRETFQVFPDI
jgi:hypothetical protein